MNPTRSITRIVIRVCGVSLLIVCVIYMCVYIQICVYMYIYSYIN